MGTPRCRGHSHFTTSVTLSRWRCSKRRSVPTSRRPRCSLKALAMAPSSSSFRNWITEPLLP